MIGLLPFDSGDDYIIGMNEYDLLKAFRDERSEEAFAELVQRYAGLVYSVAKRRLANANLAEDITQMVFIRFAKCPPKVQSDSELAAWLHRTTVNVTIDTWRSESRRRNRENRTVVMEPTTPENTLWEELSPILDEALNQLQDEDRQALVLRFFGQKKMRDVGAALGVSEDAAKMRVSRALDRLRTQLGVAGVTCTSVILESILDQRSVEAAPVQLVSRLATIKLPRVAATAGMVGLLGALLPTSKLALATGALLLAVVSVSVVHFVNPSVAPALPAMEITNSQTASTVPRIPTLIANRMRAAGADFNTSLAATTPRVKVSFRVLDADTGEGLAGTQIHAAFFGAGGIGESHNVLTDSHGLAAIPEPDDAAKGQVANIFVVAERHVPKSVSFRNGKIPADYTIQLDRAATVGGSVVDETGQPVAGVTITIEGPGIQPGRMENVEFGTCHLTNHDDGSWSCSYLPRDFTNGISFILNKDGYAATSIEAPVTHVDLSNLTFIIKRGFTVTGHILDLQNLPIANARIKSLDGDVDKRKSAKTDENGGFILTGLSGEAELEGGPSRVELAVQADGFAPKAAAVTFSGTTNVVNFTLAPGKIFQGRVVDQTGNPIPNAVVRTDYDFKNQIQTKFNWLAHTDRDGRFEWDSAPAEEICYWFEADGYTVIRGRPLLADGSDHEITLERAPIK